MPFYLVENDITTMKVDAIVNAANQSLLGGGGVDGAIHRAAGPDLLRECRTLGGCPTGQAKITKGYRLPASYVIHTVGPVWRGGSRGERQLLVSAYRSSLELALDHGCRTVAFPLISSGVYGYPWDQALNVAVETIGGFVADHDLTAYLVIFDRKAYTIRQSLFAQVSAWVAAGTREAAARPETGLSAAGQMREDFFPLLRQRMAGKAMTVEQFCRKANLDREDFSRLEQAGTRPSKTLVMAFALALELPREETRELLEQAGYTLDPAQQTDRIVEYFLCRQNYDIFTINEVLFAFGRDQLGG